MVVVLIQSFYQFDLGSILFDGIDLKELDLKWLWEYIVVVLQEVLLFVGIIFENIWFGKFEVFVEEV